MKIHLIKGDITKLHVDAIVNAANNSLTDGAGVNGAIHKAGGPQIVKECTEIRSKQGGCKTGEAVITSAGNLPSKYIIHTVGPVWHGGNNNEEALLANAYDNSLQLAAQCNIRSIAFPNISTGIFGFPKDRAASIAVSTVKKFTAEYLSVADVYFICYDEENFLIYEQLLAGYA